MDKQEREVQDLLPAEWDQRAWNFAMKISELLKQEPGVVVTGSGSGNGFADVTFEYEGADFYFSVAAASALDLYATEEEEMAKVNIDIGDKSCDE